MAEMGITDSKQELYQEVANILAEADNRTALFILTGAGMSVCSGVPVFRRADGKMTDEFLKFLSDYNLARRNAGKREANDWFNFSVPEMFEKATEKEAWAYWFWRITRARVDLAEDYTLLMNIINKFGMEKTFVQTSNCDMLHAKAGVPEDKIYEIHGSLGWVNCSKSCCNDILPVSTIEENIQDGTPPQCPKGCGNCLRPNVMIFGDYHLVEDRIENQRSNFYKHCCKYPKRIVIEIGAGTVVASIRASSKSLTSNALDNPLIRINPDTKKDKPRNKYIPIPATGGDALGGIWNIYKDL